MQLANRNFVLNPALWAVLAYVFFSVIPHASAPRYISAGLMLIVAVYQLMKGQLQRPCVNMVTLSLLVLLVMVSLSALVSPFRLASLAMLYKETLPFLLAFFLLISQKLDESGRERVVKYAVGALIAGYGVKLLLAIWAGAVTNNWNFSIYEGTGQLPRYLDFFAADIIYYLPFLMGTLLFWPLGKTLRFLVLLITALTLVFALISGVRTTFVFTSLTFLIFIFSRYWDKKWHIIVVLTLCLSVVYALRNEITNQSVSRYHSIFSVDTYKFGKDGSVSERKAIALGTWEIAKDRFLLGYGLGWKKLATVASKEGYIDRWSRGGEEWHPWALDHFSRGEGRVNPHNFYLMVLFEIGLLGLISYLIFMLTIGVKSLMGYWRRSDSLVLRGGYLSGLVYIGIYFASGIAGGAWLPTTLLVSALIVAFFKGTALKDNGKY